MDWGFEGMGDSAARCIICGFGYTEEQLEGVSQCPTCKAKSLPMDTADDVTIKTNWHELRVLVIWAEWWASRHKDEDPEMVDVVRMIAARIGAQHPQKGPLTFSGEVEDLRAKGYQVWQNVVIEKGGLQ